MAILSPSEQLDKLLGRENANGSKGWIGDAIYGVNDGLGAIFGIIAGVAGYTASSHTVLVSGFFGAVASTLSMGAGAWLATRSENELVDKKLREAEEDIRRHRDRELEILSLMYETRGFESQDAERIAGVLAQDERRFLQIMAQEKHGIHESSHGNPWSSAWFGAISTFVGAIVPLIPFFFMTGTTALITAAIVSLVAHFAVGAAKSIVTVRSWLASGLEMTVAGIIVGVLSYALGLLGTHIIGPTSGIS